ncbi:protein indeterminate-domain 4, chloroplastic-like isoform X2 [Lotus japonicus]|nr:protein indeterminate-domain 4, chloroplastic-like isoform X2 [Lotus japonicus]XP_057424879.1 protein indeterminate-domain 4, chloroplastic-like isoform X2 [Lotus japonicus]
MAAASSSSSPFFGIREENSSQITHLHQSPTAASSAALTTMPQKKRRNQPGTPSPDAEVIALSPKTLMATNRFICEVCNKGFQREQNLQLHRRGHNLPWKLKQKSNKEPRRKVYLCPEPTCVHHDPSRALGDLTGIKKHYSRKHGEKKWKCEKCSKKYAVQSDWKAHSKTCGTREYRCDCGTLFSRRDSFITHRAFCDALAQESARLPNGLTPLGTNLYGTPTNHMTLGLSQIGTQISQQLQNHNQNATNNNTLRLTGAAKFEHLIPSLNQSSSFGVQHSPQQSIPSSAFFMTEPNQTFDQEPHQGPFSNKNLNGLMQLPDLQGNNNTNSNSPSNLFNLSFFPNSTMMDQFNNHQGTTSLYMNNNNNNPIISDHHQVGNSGLSSSLFGNSLQHENMSSPHMSATALLQKAAQMGSTATTTKGAGGSSILIRGMSTSSSTYNNNDSRSDTERDLVSDNNIATFGSDQRRGEGVNVIMRTNMENDRRNLHGLMINSITNGNNTSIFGNMQGNEKLPQNLDLSFGGSDKLTLDFLGVGGMMRNINSGGEHQQQRVMDPHDLKSAQSTQLHFGSSTMQ